MPEPMVRTYFKVNLFDMTADGLPEDNEVREAWGQAKAALREAGITEEEK